MTTYTTIPDSDIDPESPGTGALFTLIRDNPIAITEKAAGAPVLANDYVVQAMIDSAAVGQAELNTATVESSATSQVLVNPTNTNYAFHPRTKFSAATNRAAVVRMPGSLTYATTTSYRLLLELDPGGSGTVYSYIRYVQASPPYDLGDGNIPLFIFALIDNVTGDIVSVSSAEEAPWHTDFQRATEYKNGKGYRFISRSEKAFLEGKDVKRMLIDPRTRDEAVDILEDTKGTMLEITQDIKNAFMNDVPHPFTANNNQGKTVVMLDPVCDITRHLAEATKVGDSINDLFHDSYFHIDNEHSGRKGPAGLIIPKFRWKNNGN